MPELAKYLLTRTGKLPTDETISFKLVNTPMVLANNGGEVNLIGTDGTKRQTDSYTRAQARSGAFILFGN